ncbi:bifunctional salicyl-AMP ligase/salicyl-S-ArCP synthetase MbtA [Streptomyces amakusaensis]|uniref:(2,3-dihydroxybenzoyl)adenylate synthase n=1 Tax=Streptomyces amakusaensis TaxID=67271 RepID=A0ABW0AUR3_9ACTN
MTSVPSAPEGTPGPASLPDGPAFTPWPAEDARRYRDLGHWRGTALGELPRAWAARSGDRTALVSGDRRLSYTELDRRADTLAAGLLALGIAPGDRVLVQLPNSADFAVLLFALARCAAIPVLTLPAHRRSEIAHLAALSEAVAYVVPDRHAGFDHRALAAEVAERVPTLRHILVAGDPGPFTALDGVSAEPGPLPTADPSAPAVLLVSGGTTGKPKLIPRTHDDYAYNARASAEVCRLGPADVYLAALPAAHNFPLACPGLLGIWSAGGTAVMAPAPSPDVAFPLIEREGVTVTALVPPMARLWTEYAEWSPEDLSSLRLLQVGGARLDPDLARRIPPALGCSLQQVFGMAEGLLSYTRPEDGPETVATTQGRPLSPQDEVRVLDRDGAPVADGTVGELWARGPYTLRGYYRAARHNAGAFSPDGFFRTGDLVRRLPTGHLVVEGRAKDVVNRGGENVSASELEEHLLAHPGIAQAAVVPLPDETLGELVCAVVTAAPGAERPRIKEVKAHLADRGLADFMHPDRLVVLDTLPLTAVGKISKRDLVARLTDEAG